MLRKPKHLNNPAMQTGKNLPNRVTAYSPNRPHSPKEEPQAHPQIKKSIWKRLIFWFLIILFVAILVVGVWDARNISSASQKLFGSGNLLNLVRGGPLKQTDSGRVNVLIAGYSVDDPGHPGATLTDSIILLSMSRSTKTGYLRWSAEAS
jgi:hypothetical protein